MAFPAAMKPALYFDFEPDLHDLRDWNPEIRRREIGVEVHGGEQGFSPHRHARCFVGGDHHHPPEIIGDGLGIDAPKLRMEAGELQPVHHVRGFHEAEIEENARDARADRHELDAIGGVDPRLIDEIKGN